MLIDKLAEFEEKLIMTNVDQKSIINDRLNKINAVYLNELMKSSHVVERSSLKSFFKGVSKGKR